MNTAYTIGASYALKTAAAEGSLPHVLNVGWGVLKGNMRYGPGAAARKLVPAELLEDLGARPVRRFLGSHAGGAAATGLLGAGVGAAAAPEGHRGEGALRGAAGGIVGSTLGSALDVVPRNMINAAGHYGVGDTMGLVTRGVLPILGGLLGAKAGGGTIQPETSTLNRLKAKLGL